MAAAMTPEQKRSLLENGFVVLRSVVPLDAVERARELITSRIGDPSGRSDKGTNEVLTSTNVDYDAARERRLLTGEANKEGRTAKDAGLGARTADERPPPPVNTHDDVVGLFNDSPLTEILGEAMGPHSPVISCQIAFTPPTDDPRALEARQGAHVDGGYAGPIEQSVAEIEASGRSLHDFFHDGDPMALGPSGGAPLWQDPERRLSIGSYTALVGVCLNDQTVPGRGQLAVRRGAHEPVQRFFQMQREQGGPLGAEGPLWPRLQASGKDGQLATAGVMPTAMTEQWPKDDVQIGTPPFCPCPHLYLLLRMSCGG